MAVFGKTITAISLLISLANMYEVAGQGLTVRFEQSRYSVREGDFLSFRLIALGTFSSNFSVNVSLQPVSAEPSVDYLPIPPVSINYTVAHFVVGNTSSTPISISAVANNAWERDEEFKMIIESGDFTVGFPGEASVVILDNDQVLVRFDRETQTVNEGGGDVGLRLVASGIYSATFRVSVLCLEVEPVEAVIVMVGDNETGISPDVRVGTLQASFTDLDSANTTSSEMTLGIVDDSISEPTESFICIILRPFRDTGIIVSDPDTISMTINDDDVLTVQFQRSRYTGTEGGRVFIRLRASRHFTQPFSASIFTFTLGSRHRFKAVEASPDDYDLTAEGVVQFVPNSLLSNRLIINLPDDGIFENTEYFGVAFSFIDEGVESSLRKRQGSMDTVLVSVSDRESVKLFLRFQRNNYTAEVGDGVVHIFIEAVMQDPSSPSTYLPANHSVDFEVEVETMDGTAKAGIAYLAAKGSVAFSQGQPMSTSFDVQLTSRVATAPEEFSVVMSLNVRRSLSTRIEIINNKTIVTLPYEAFVPEFVNDTIIGDPLFTIPLPDVPAVEFPELQGVSLCMEFHGLADKYYNLVSDSCTNVNAHYDPGVANPDLHIIDEIGVKAEGSGGACHEVRVQLAGCRTFVDGTEMTGMYRSDGVMVFAMPSRNRTRITVPNCSTNKELVMWVTCERIGSEPNLDDTLHLTLSRALGLEPTSHGLVGQFWNIPMNYTRYIGRYGNNNITEGGLVYAVTVHHPTGEPRTFLGELFTHTWDQSLKPCIYAGGSLGGPSLEGIAFSSVIEGMHFDYETSGIFVDDFRFSGYTSEC